MQGVCENFLHFVFFTLSNVCGCRPYLKLIGNIGPENMFEWIFMMILRMLVSEIDKIARKIELFSSNIWKSRYF